MVTETQMRNNRRWDKNNTRRFQLKFMLKSDADVIAKLDSVSNKNDYIRQLIRKDLNESDRPRANKNAPSL